MLESNGTTDEAPGKEDDSNSVKEEEDESEEEHRSEAVNGEEKEKEEPEENGEKQGEPKKEKEEADEEQEKEDEKPSDVEADAAESAGDESPHENGVDDKEEKEELERIPSDRILLYNLSKGFMSLSNRRSGKKEPAVPIAERPICSCATVNFIDPTASLVATTPTSKFNILSPLSKQSTPPPPAENASVDLYPKLTSIFERDYQSTLHGVPYQNARSGKQEAIEQLYIRSIVTKAHGVGDSYVPWGGTAATAAAPVSDPAEWHNGPHCHVYIAACEGMEHYRQKVKPALQAFVSQIEGAAGNSSSTKDSGNSLSRSSHSRNSSHIRNSRHGSSMTADTAAKGNYSAHYVIVYVPINKSGGGPPTPVQSPAQTPSASTAKRMGSLASRMRRQIQHTTSASSRPEISSDSAHSGVTSATADTTEEPDLVSGEMSLDPSAAPPPGPIAHSSRVEKELYRKFTTDFPNGKTCIMTTLMDSLEESSVATTSPLKNQEWNTFLRMLGSAIVNGFKDRCRRYDEELRRLDTHRAAARSPTRKKNSKKPEGKFDLSHFFLVKESLAFTYEQMQLPGEALLQYVELGAFVMEAAAVSDGLADSVVAEELTEEADYDGLAKRRSMRKSASSANMGTAMDLAVAGDTVGFRRRLRGVQDLIPELSLVLQYLYARETSLLFQLAAPVEVIQRSHVFIETVYTMRVKGIAAVAKTKSEKFTQGEQQRKRTEAEKWALKTCWDVKCACDNFFSSHFAMIRQLSEATMGQENGATDQISEDGTPGSPVMKSTPDPALLRRITVDVIHVEAASQLSELLEFARLRLLYLGDTLLEGENPIRSMSSKGLPEDMKKPWEPWKPSEKKESASPAKDNMDANRSASLEERPPWLDGMFDSKESYESKYVELVAAIVALCRLAGRRRIAARLQAERAEIHILRGEYDLAVKTLLPAVNICAEDRWDRGHFWRLFRLACCQRESGDAASYLNTLTRCFGSRLSSVAPAKAAVLLQQDLEAVVGDEEISKYHLGISPFLETELSVEATSAGNLITPSSSMRKKVVKHFCSVGETTAITLTLTSHLPKAIELNSVRLFLVTFDKYETIYVNRGDVEDELEEAFRILTFDSPTIVEPGTNEFKLNWIPMCTGQYILATVEVRWKASCFFYRSCAMRKPLMGIDVVPSDPTQTVELHPLFLMPGHVQPVRISFNPGSDVITEGSVELVCSNGLEVIPPGSDPKDEEWGQSCKILIPSCGAGEKIVFTTSVKSSINMGLNDDDGETERKSRGAVQTMRATVATSYHHALFDQEKSEEENTQPMRTVLEAVVTTLDKPALTLDSSNAFSCTSDMVIIRVSLHCNTPVPFYIKEWEIRLPEPLLVAEDGDLNKDLYGHAISEGETIFFGFRCMLADALLELSESYDAEPLLHVVLQDEFGKTFNQVLALDLNRFYENIRKEDEHTATKGVAVELQCSSEEGLVGAPVSFTYHVDTSTLTKPSRRFSLSRATDSSTENILLYSISCDNTDWIIGGEVEGVLPYAEGSVFDLKFVGIPTCPGVLKKFPKISLQYHSEEGDTPPIMVIAEQPDFFTSLSYVNHMALAYPAVLESA